MPAIIEAWKAGLLRRDSLARNIAAGLVVGVVALPLAMAFAIASGAKPEQGLYTALIAGLIVSLFGGTRVQIAGPTGAFAVLLFGVTQKHGIAGLQVVTLMAGAILVLFGLARLGGVIRYIPESVVLGFTAGIAIVIWVGQWGNFLGLPAVQGENLIERLPGIIASIPSLHVPTTMLAVACLLVLIVWPRIPVVSAAPSPMIVLAGATAFIALFRPEGVATIGTVFGGIPRGLPAFSVPPLSLSFVMPLVQPAFAVALLGAIESLLSATVADGLQGTKHDPNQELVGQGLANVGASLFGGFAATGALARTATGIRHGADTPVAGITHALVVALVLVALAPLAASVPLAALAAILFVVAFNMSQAGRVLRLVRHAPRSDVGVMLITLGLAVLADLSLAVEVGVILALLNFFRRMSAAVEVRTVGEEEYAGHLSTDGSVSLPEGTLVYAIEGPFFFGAIEQFESALSHTHTDPRAVIMNLSNVPFIDLTGLVALEDTIAALAKRDVTVALCCAGPALSARLEKSRVHGTLGLPASASLAETVKALSDR